MARFVSGPSVTSVISPGRRRASSRIRSTRVAVAQRAARRRQLGVAETLRPVRLGRRLEPADERDLAAHRDLDVGPTDELEDGPGVDADLLASMLPDTQVTATRSASGDAAA